jgi:hypothetical protein
MPGHSIIYGSIQVLGKPYRTIIGWYYLDPCKRIAEPIVLMALLMRLTFDQTVAALAPNLHR